MVEEKEQGQTVYNQPAGHLDENETLFDAALRETLEETAWHVELRAYLGTYQYLSPANNITYVRHCFIANPLSYDASRSLDPDIVGTHWLSADTILAEDFQARSPIVRKVIEDYLKGQHYPLCVIYCHE